MAASYNTSLPMPTLISAQFFVLTGILVCVVLLTIAFHLQGRAVQDAENGSLPPTPPDIPPFTLESPSHQKAARHPSLVLVPLLLIIIVGRWFTRTTYYDYFLYAALFWPLFAITTTAIFIASLTTRAILANITQWWARALMHLMLLACTVTFGWATITILPHDVMDDMLALYDGPQLAAGHVEAKDSIGGRGPIASIVVDGIRYETFDFTWWNGLHSNQMLHFVRDPAHTAAFEPSRIALTPVGCVVSACIGAVWLWIGGFVVWRYRHSIAARRRR
jgi:hypothetical protein